MGIGEKGQRLSPEVTWVKEPGYFEIRLIMCRVIQNSRILLVYFENVKVKNLKIKKKKKKIH